MQRPCGEEGQALPGTRAAQRTADKKRAGVRKERPGRRLSTSERFLSRRRELGLGCRRWPGKTVGLVLDALS